MHTKETFNDKFMVINRSVEDGANVEFHNSHLGLALALKDLIPTVIPHLIVLRRRHSDATSWRNVELIPRFYIHLVDQVFSHFYLQPFDTTKEQVPFPVPKDGDLGDAVRSQDGETIYEILLADFSPMLCSLDLVHDLHPMP